MKKKKKLTHEQRVLLLALLAGLPGSAVALFLLWWGAYTLKVQLTFTVLIVAFWLGFVFSLQGRVVFPLRTLANLLAALREGDYSLRGRGASRDDAMGEVVLEVNVLGDTLRQQRLAALEATSLLRKVMQEIDVAVFTFDGAQRLRLVNRTGERLLARPAEQVMGRSAAELGLAECLEGEPSRTVDNTFPGGAGRWGIHRSTFRESGLPHQLLVISDLSRALREEERQAWQRLIRVLGHELNNSLTPIKSIAGSLERLLRQGPRAADWHNDMQQGLRVIGARAEALSRFMEAYARLARLPPPRLRPVEVGPWIRRVVELENRLRVCLRPGPDLAIQADGDQLEQLLINLVCNAVDAALETGGGVTVGWGEKNACLEVWIEDEGPGLSNPANLFVPFYTTKPGGTGIGLVLCRQIAEAHGGTLTLENRRAGRGCGARLRLPL